MRFAPQQRALFEQLNFQKCSEVCLTFWLFGLAMCFAPEQRALFLHFKVQKRRGAEIPLPNLLRATAACNF